MNTKLSQQTITFESVTLNRCGEIVQRSPGQAQVAVHDLGGGVSLVLVEIPGGMCQVGSRHGEGYADETPRHVVNLAPFLLGQAPVTQAQWQAVMGKAHYWRFTGPDLPVHNLTWVEAVEFCQKLSKKSSLNYRLPSEAQWEYACRAGTQTPFSTGETITTDYANYVGNHLYREEAPGTYRHVPTPGGTFLPNPFGLYDMHANVWEYCADRWHEDYSGAPVDGTAWNWGGETGFRVTRGGSWHEPPVNCRSATRLRVSERDGEDYYSFRVLLNPAG